MQCALAFRSPRWRQSTTIRHFGYKRTESYAFKSRHRRNFRQSNKTEKKELKDTLDSQDKQGLDESPRTVSDLSQRFVTPLFYRKNGHPYSREHAHSLLQRLPFALVLFGFLSWDQTRPFHAVRFSGPSMIPTIAVDGSEVWWACSTWVLYLWRIRNLFGGTVFRKGDIVGFSPPEQRDHVACKRVIGLPGDTVASYGQYVKVGARTQIM